MESIHKIGFGGGCHWCTEAVFQAVTGVQKVEQGYIASSREAADFSEAVIVHYHPSIISSKDLIRIHLHTHNSTSDHSFRRKYRSAVYFFIPEERADYLSIIEELQQEFDKALVTQALPFREFRASRDSIQNYYRKNPDAPFCKRYIEPKLEIIKKEFQ